MDIKKLKQMLQRAEDVRRHWEPLFEECYDYALPNRAQFRQAAQPGARREGDRNTDYLFDSTAVVGIQEFASRLQYNMLPPFARWARLVPGKSIPEEDRDELQEALDEITDKVFAALSQSTFDQDLNEALLDLAVSQGHLLIEDSEVPGEALACRSVPLSNIHILVGLDGKLKAVFYSEVQTASSLLEEHGEDIPVEKRAELKNGHADREVRLVDAFVRTSGSIRSPEWTRTKFLMQPECVIGEPKTYTGEGSSPWIVFRWTKGSGETYGRGPLLAVLPAIRSVNAMMEFILEAAEWAVSGAYQADDDGVINPDTVILEPRAIIPRQPGSRIDPIESGSDFNVGLELVAHMQDAIKKGLYNERLGPREGTPPTAFEIQERMLELARDIGASFGRLQAELARPVMLRTMWILDRKGEIELPRVDGRVVDIEVQSPLAQAQRIEDVQNVTRFGETIQAMLGPQMAMVVLEGIEVATFLAERLMVPAKLVRGKREAEQLLQQVMQAAQQAQAAEQAQAAPPPTLNQR